MNNNSHAPHKTNKPNLTIAKNKKNEADNTIPWKTTSYSYE